MTHSQKRLNWRKYLSGLVMSTSLMATVWCYPSTALSANTASAVILTQAKQYGFILGDNGTDWDASVDGSGYFPFAYNAAFLEIANAAIAPTNFEVVDPSAELQGHDRDAD
jgi:hypothetical protein